LSRHIVLLRIFSSLSLAEAFLALLSLTRIAGDAKHAILWGYSLSRLFFLALLLILCLITLGLTIKIWQDRKWVRKAVAFVEMLRSKRSPFASALGFFAVILIASYFFFFSSSLKGALGAYHPRLAPIILWLASIATLASLCLLLWQADWSRLKNWRGVLSASALAGGIILILWGGIAISRLGLTPDRVWWSEPGTPILALQVFLAWGIGFALLLGSGKLEKLITRVQQKWGRIFNLDLILCILLWLMAFLIWAAEPLNTDFFITKPVPPNFEYYPYSDATVYDINAQSLLIGEGLLSSLDAKPLYSVLLALFHGLVGQNYIRVVTAQVALLAILPVVVFLTTSALSNRAAGLVAAILIILRERNSIALTNVIRVSHSKLIMTDVPTMLAVLILAFLIIFWLKKPGERFGVSLLVGGALGLTALMRGQILALIPLVLFGALMVLRHQLPLWIKSSLLIVFGVMISLSPWLWRNYLTTGRFSFSELLMSGSVLAQKYSLAPEIRTERPMYETGEMFKDRMQGQVIPFILGHPDQVIQFVSAHFFHNLVETAIYLPASLQVEDIVQYVRRLPFWKFKWDGSLPGETHLLLTINLAFIALGLGTSWKRVREITFIPLLLSLGYFLSVAVARVSGWRFILPADWIAVMFYSMGLVQLTIIGLSIFLPELNLSYQNQPKETREVECKTRLRWPRVAFFGLCLLLGGAILPIAEHIVPPRYSLYDNQGIITLYQNALASTPTHGAPSPEEIAVFLNQDGAVYLYGRALYPRFYQAGHGVSNTARDIFRVEAYNRLAFYLVGSQRAGVILPLQDSPSTFPNASDVLVFGCQAANEHSVDALVIARIDEPATILMRTPWPEFSCPFPNP
jgi:hypothetical protein